MKKVAIVYHYLAAYRLPIFQELMQSGDVAYTILAGTDSEIDIRKIPERYAELAIADGGLRWELLQNKWWLRQKLLWQKGLVSRVLRGKYDAFIFLGSPYFVSTWLAVAIARLRGKKVYYWMHGFYGDKAGPGDYIKLFLFYKLAHGFFLYGNRAARCLEKYRVKPADDMHVIYNSLNYKESKANRRFVGADDIRKARETWFGNPAVPVIGFIGRLNAIKRIDLLLHAQKLLKDERGQDCFNLVLIGDGSEKAALLRLAADLGLTTNVVFLGALYDEKEIGEVLAYCDLCVTPGEVGLTAIHSLSYGTPNISHDNLSIQMPEVEAIKVGVSGDLFVYNDTRDLAERIARWLDKHPIKTESVMADCYKVVDDFYNPTYQAKIFNSVLTR